MNYYVDTYVAGHKNLMRRLNMLKGVICTFDGAYREDLSLCRLLVSTDKTEEQLENWLWKTKGVDYIGVCEAGRAEDYSDLGLE